MTPPAAGNPADREGDVPATRRGDRPVATPPPVPTPASTPNPAPAGGTAPTRRRRVIVVGGGIAGLATAWHLRDLAATRGRAVDVTVLEAAGRPGGKIVTERVDGFVVEGGPDSFLTAKPWAVELCRALGLGDRLIPVNPERRAVYVFAGGRLHRVPDGFRLIAPTRLWPFVRSGLISWPGKLRMALDLVRPPRRGGGDESIGAFVRRRLGDEALVRLGEPMMAGIFVGDPDRLSLRATFPQFAAMEAEHGGVIRGVRAAGRAARRAAAGAPTPPMFVSLAGGTEELVEALAADLGPAVLRLGVVVAAVALPAAAGGAYRATLADGAALEADAIVLATPAPITARLLAPCLPDLARQIGAIRHLSTATVSLGYARADVAHPLDGTGFVVARDAPLRVVACTWSSSKYAGRAPDGAVLLRAFVGGEGREADVDLSDDDLVALVRRDVDPVLGITATPRIARVFRWRASNPQYDVGHLDRVAAIEAACPPGLRVVGGAYRDVGVPGCVKQARDAASAILMQS